MPFNPEKLRWLSKPRDRKPPLQELHEGVPSFMLVCGGLGNTEERLAELGVSRLTIGHSHALGPLSVLMLRDSPVSSHRRSFRSSG